MIFSPIFLKEHNVMLLNHIGVRITLKNTFILQRRILRVMFFDEAKRLMSENPGIAKALANEWIIDRAYKAIIRCIPKSKCNEIDTLLELYYSSVVDFAQEQKSYNVGKEI